MEQVEMERFCRRARLVIDFLVSCRQWDGVNMTDVDTWLANFQDDIRSRYYALRLLFGLLYYSEHDMETLLREGLHRILVQDLVRKQAQTGFALGRKELETMLLVENAKTVFVPLSVKGKPYESGNQISRMLVLRVGIPKENVMTIESLISRQTEIGRIVICDDCLGSGQQLSEFWSSCMLGPNGPRMRDWCRDFGISPWYLTLIGYDDTVDRLGVEYPDLSVVCVESLSDAHRVFSPSSVFWKDAKEAVEARCFFEQVTLKNSVDFLGYCHLDFAAILHVTIPDWSLPLLWQKTPTWCHLLRRKDS